MYISRAHRLGPRKIGQRVYSRPIIVNFRDFCDTDLIMSKAYMLERTPFSVGYDLPKEINEARKKLWEEVKTIKTRQPNAKYQIVYPAKLLVEGKVIRDEFPDWHSAMKGSRIAEFSHIDINFSFDQPNSQLNSHQHTGISTRDYTTTTTTTHSNSNMNGIPSNDDVSRDIELQSIHNSESGHMSHDEEINHSNAQKANGQTNYSITRMNEAVNALKESESRSSSVCSGQHTDSSGVIKPAIFRPFTSDSLGKADLNSQTGSKYSGHHVSRSLQRGTRRSPSQSVPRSNSKNTRGSTNEQPSANENSSHPQHNMTDHNNDKGSRASSPDGDSNTDVNEQTSTNM